MGIARRVGRAIRLGLANGLDNVVDYLFVVA